MNQTLTKDIIKTPERPHSYFNLVKMNLSLLGTTKPPAVCPCQHAELLHPPAAALVRRCALIIAQRLTRHGSGYSGSLFLFLGVA